jgi:2-polyprenyl-3-methyl-5-hydroxy-6-metoxy-1,4-benzoquinol methylase
MTHGMQGSIEGIRVEAVPECPLCGSTGTVKYPAVSDRWFGSPGQWRISWCAHCVLAWLNPRPIEEDLGKLYSEYYTHSVERRKRLQSWRSQMKQDVLARQFGYPASGRASSIWRPLTRSALFRERVGASVMWLPRKEEGRLLDVGCGNGEFLATMRSLGWEVHGVEPDADAAAAARGLLGDSVVHGLLGDSGYPPRSFDAIVLSHVIEHVSDPAGFLLECRDLLKPTGTLSVLTPNVEGWGSRLFKERWRGLEPPRHIHVFSVTSLRKLLIEAHLSPVVVRTSANAAPFIWQTAAGRKRFPKLLGRLGMPFFWIAESSRSRRSSAGEEVLALARPEEVA